MKQKNPAAVALGKMGLGVSRNFSKAERERRRARLIALNKARGKRKAK